MQSHHDVQGSDQGSLCPGKLRDADIRFHILQRECQQLTSSLCSRMSFLEQQSALYNNLSHLVQQLRQNMTVWGCIKCC